MTTAVSGSMRWERFTNIFRLASRLCRSPRSTQRAQLPYHHGVQSQVSAGADWSSLSAPAWLGSARLNGPSSAAHVRHRAASQRPTRRLEFPRDVPWSMGVFRSVTAASSGAIRPCGGQEPHPCPRPRRPAWISRYCLGSVRDTMKTQSRSQQWLICLGARGKTAVTVPCDVSDRRQGETMVEAVARELSASRACSS